MNNPPYRVPPSTTEAEEAIPDFRAPVPWSRRRRLVVLAIGYSGLACCLWSRLHGDDGAWITMLAIKSLFIVAGAVLVPAIDRWRAERNACAITRLVGEDR